MNISEGQHYSDVDMVPRPPLVHNHSVTQEMACVMGMLWDHNIDDTMERTGLHVFLDSQKVGQPKPISPSLEFTDQIGNVKTPFANMS